MSKISIKSLIITASIILATAFNCFAVRTETEAYRFTNEVTFDGPVVGVWHNPINATNWTWTSDGKEITLDTYHGPQDVVVPSMIDGLPVTKLSLRVFDGDNITSITGTENITDIGVECFTGSAALNSIDLSSVKNIGDEAFVYCTNLMYVYFNSDVPTVGYNIYLNLTSVTNYVKNSTATGWGSTFAGSPVVRSAVMGTKDACIWVGDQVNTDYTNSLNWLYGKVPKYDDVAIFDKDSLYPSMSNPTGTNSARLSIFKGTVFNFGVVNGNVECIGSGNFGTFNGNLKMISGSVGGTINGNVECTASIMQGGTINGNAKFYRGTWADGGAINGDVYLYSSSYLNGGVTVGGFLHVDPTAFLYEYTGGKNLIVYENKLFYPTPFPNMTEFVDMTNKTVNANIRLPNVEWIDLIAPGVSFGTGPAAPTLTDTGLGLGLQAEGFDNSDLGYGCLQMPHNLALTNANRSVLFVEPHVHWSLAVAPTSNTNITWRLIYAWANINDGGFLTKGTSTVTVSKFQATNSFITSFGQITNNIAGISSIFRFRIDRPASANDDFGNNHDVLLDQFDIHVPVDRLGSSQILAQ